MTLQTRAERGLIASASPGERLLLLGLAFPLGAGLALIAAGRRRRQ